MASDLKRSFDRYYLGMSALEIRQSDWAKGVDRLPYNTVLYLDMIAFNPGITASQISERLGLTKATVSATISRLVERGMIVSERSSEDGRVRNLRLSYPMAEVYEMSDRSVAWMVSRLESMYSPDDVSRFAEMLEMASEILEEWTPEASADRSRAEGLST